MVILLLAPALSGCVVAAAALVAGAAVGTYHYVKGNMLREYNASVARCWNASLETCRRMQLDKPRGNPPDAAGGVMYSRRPADGSKVTIEFRSTGPGRTQVGVRFGDFGDEKISEDFHALLAEELTRR